MSDRESRLANIRSYWASPSIVRPELVDKVMAVEAIDWLLADGDALAARLAAAEAERDKLRAEGEAIVQVTDGTIARLERERDAERARAERLAGETASLLVSLTKNRDDARDLMVDADKMRAHLAGAYWRGRMDGFELAQKAARAALSASAAAPAPDPGTHPDAQADAAWVAGVRRAEGETGDE